MYVSGNRLDLGTLLIAPYRRTDRLAISVFQACLVDIPGCAGEATIQLVAVWCWG